jgi:bifunctional enzyme CysN/CysC
MEKRGSVNGQTGTKLTSATEISVGEVSPHSFTVLRNQRERLNGYRAGVIWMTGLSGSGKSTIADRLEIQLTESGIRACVLDGDEIRSTLSSDLGFSPADRAENVRRVARVAHMMMDAGLLVIVSLVSPFRADREAARSLFDEGDFVEVFVDTPLAICQQRDPKGLYRKAIMDSSTQMTGIGRGYEEPLHAEFHLDGTASVTSNVDLLAAWVGERRFPGSSLHETS